MQQSPYDYDGYGWYLFSLGTHNHHNHKVIIAYYCRVTQPATRGRIIFGHFQQREREREKQFWTSEA